LDARKIGLECESLNDMAQLSAEMVAEFPERGMQWVKDRVETVVNETGEYVREKPTQSLFYAFAVGYVLNRLPLGRVLAGLLRLLFMALKPAILIYGAARLYRSAQEREVLQRKS
jgi:hypothetical protein